MGFLHGLQIHKATLSEWGADKTGKPAGTVVAVKVRHPGVSTVMQRDFVLMQRAAALSTRMPILRDLNLQESVRQFGAPLREQLDLSSEAQNLARFNRNFRKWKNLSFPEPIYPLVAPDVLVSSHRCYLTYMTNVWKYPVQILHGIFKPPIN